MRRGHAQNVAQGSLGGGKLFAAVLALLTPCPRRTARGSLATRFTSIYIGKGMAACGTGTHARTLGIELKEPRTLHVRAESNHEG